MLSALDLADLISYAKARGAKVILAGDISQLQAVENGGGMSLLAGSLGYARLAEPVRFRNRWEQAASLRLRDATGSSWCHRAPAQTATRRSSLPPGPHAPTSAPAPLPTEPPSAGTTR
jgi:hypothetical protein